MTKFKDALPAGMLGYPTSSFGTSDENVIHPGMVVGADGTSNMGNSNFHSAADPRWEWPRIGLGEHLTRQQWHIQARGTTTTLDASGVVAPTEATPGAAKAALSNSSGNFITFNTGTTINTDAGIETITGGGYCGRRELLPWFSASIFTPATISSMRMWIGLFQVSPMNSSDPALSGVGFRYDTGVSGNLVAWSNDGTLTGSTAGSVALVASTRYDLGFAFESDTRVVFFVNGQRFGTLAANLPAATQSLFLLVGVRCLLGSAARLISIARCAGTNL